MALHVATATLQRWRWLEDVPQRLGTGLTVGREVIKRGNELMAFVWETVGFVDLRDRLHVRFFSALSLVGIENLHMERGSHQNSYDVKAISKNKQSFPDSDIIGPGYNYIKKKKL